MLKMTLTKKQRKRIKELNPYITLYKILDLDLDLYADGGFDKWSNIGKVFTKYSDVQRFISQLSEPMNLKIIKLICKVEEVSTIY